MLDYDRELIVSNLESVQKFHFRNCFSYMPWERPHNTLGRIINKGGFSFI